MTYATQMAEQHNNNNGNMRNTGVLLRCAVDPQKIFVKLSAYADSNPMVIESNPWKQPLTQCFNSTKKLNNGLNGIEEKGKSLKATNMTKSLRSSQASQYGRFAYLLLQITGIEKGNKTKNI